MPGPLVPATLSSEVGDATEPHSTLSRAGCCPHESLPPRTGREWAEIWNVNGSACNLYMLLKTHVFIGFREMKGEG